MPFNPQESAPLRPPGGGNRHLGPESIGNTRRQIKFYNVPKAPKLIYTVILWYRFVVRPPRGLRPTVSCQRFRPQVSMGTEGAQRSMGTKGAGRKCLLCIPTLS